MDIQSVTANSFLQAPGWPTGSVGRVDIDLDRLAPDLDLDLDRRSRRSVESDLGSREGAHERGGWRPSNDEADARSFVAFARSTFDAQITAGSRPGVASDGRARPGRGWTSSVDAVADPGLRRAAETLGVTGILSRDEVDRRFRDIVKSERPDLGTMSGERLDSLLNARAALTGHLQSVPWVIGARVPLGVGADIRA